MNRKERSFCGYPKRSGGTCEKSKGWGTTHKGYGFCRIHEKNNPNLIKAARKAMALDAMITYGLPRKVDPLTALLEEVYRTAGHVQWLELRIREMDADALVWGATKRSFEGPAIPVVADSKPVDGEVVALTRKTEEGALVSVWLALYHKERAHLVDVCRTAIGCGLAERQVRLAEEQGTMIARVIEGALGELGIEQGEQVVRVAVRKHLLLVAGEVTG